MKYNNYKILLRPEPEGGFTVTVPSLPGCITYGSTLTEAKEMAKEAIELYLESLADHDETIPNDNDTLEYNLLIESYA
jgi:predicted RNase H-like HicB family nuclease